MKESIVDLLNTEILPFSVEHCFYIIIVFMGAFYAFLYLLAMM